MITTITDFLPNHHSRVDITDEEWEKMVEDSINYLLREVCEKK